MYKESDTEYLMYPIADVLQMDFTVDEKSGLIDKIDSPKGHTHPLCRGSSLPLKMTLKTGKVDLSLGTAYVFVRIVGDLYVFAWSKITTDSTKKDRSREIGLKVLNGAAIPVDMRLVKDGEEQSNMKFPDAAVKATYLFDEDASCWTKVGKDACALDGSKL